MDTTTLRAGCAVLALALATGLSSCGGSSPVTGSHGASHDTGSDTRSDVLPGRAALLLQPAGRGDGVAQRGTAAVRTSWSRISGGRASRIAGPRGTAAWNMPDFTTGAHYPRTVLVVRNAPGQDALSPGMQDFSWGADFQLDAVSTAPTGPDNGDNLLQRGLWGESAEFKAEADLRRASCAVHGTEGTLLVRAQMQAQPGKWYRMRCYRRADSLSVTVSELSDGSWGPAVSATVSGPVGAVRFPAAMPIAVGGKIAADGALVRSATDQLNGWIANPVVEIGASR